MYFCLSLSWFMELCDSCWRSVSSHVFTVNLCSLSQPRPCMATNWQQWEWAANQPRPPVASWRPVRGTRSGSCPAGSEAPRRLARRGSCSCWWRRKSAGWNGRVRCVSVNLVFNKCFLFYSCWFVWIMVYNPGSPLASCVRCLEVENISGPNVRPKEMNELTAG